MSDLTVRNYSNCWRQYLAFCSNQNLEPITYDNLNQYILRLKQTLNPHTVSTHIYALKRHAKIEAAKVLDAAGMYALSVALSTIKADRTINTSALDKVLTDEQIERLRLRATHRIRLMIDLLLQTGIRINELTGITLSAIRDNSIDVVGKGSKIRAVKVSAIILHEIQDTFHGRVYLFETRNHTRYSNVYLSREFRLLGQRVGVPFHPHMLRHTFATRLVQMHPDKIDAISRYLGHASVSITLGLYVHTVLTDKDLDLFD